MNTNGESFSDEQLEVIRRDMYILADIALVFWEQDINPKTGNPKKNGV